MGVGDRMRRRTEEKRRRAIDGFRFDRIPITGIALEAGNDQPFDDSMFQRGRYRGTDRNRVGHRYDRPIG